MKKPLLNITTFSDKRKRLLLLLLEGNKTLDEIRARLNESSPSILPQIKILKEYKLIFQTKEGYHLTDIGKLVASELEELNDTCGAMQNLGSYLESHENTSIPMHLLERIGELKNLELKKPSLIDAFDPFSHIVDELNKSTSIKTFTTIFHATYPLIYADLLKKGVEIELIFGKEVFEKTKNKYPELIFLYMGLDNSNTYIYEGTMGPTVLICTDRFMTISLLSKTEIYDFSHFYSKDKSAIKWANDLFQYYLEKSTLPQEN